MADLVVNKRIISPANNYSFVIIGGGGNGSYLVSNLARIVSINNIQFNRKDTITVVDGDVV